MGANINIQFENSRWEHIRAVYGAWWDRALERPIVNLTFTGAPSPIKPPEGYSELSMWQYPMDTPVEYILHNDLYTISTQRFAADAFPMVLPDYGAGVNAAFCGCKPEHRKETVWFLPPSANIEISNLRLVHNPESSVYSRIRDYYLKAGDNFEGGAVVGMTHLNNGIDTVARFLDGDAMCLALRDAPLDVERLIGENHALFRRYLYDLSDCMGEGVPGYSCWGNLYGEKPWFGAQSDFCVMIGPGDFERFILPELNQCWRAFPQTNYYHLDGPGQLRHLDAILASPDLKCVQWVPGSGEARPAEWPEVYRKISQAGKNIWYVGDLGELADVADAIGSARGLYWQGRMSWEERLEAFAALKRLGLDEFIGESEIC